MELFYADGSSEKKQDNIRQNMLLPRIRRGLPEKVRTKGSAKKKEMAVWNQT